MISSPAGNDLLFDEASLEQGRFFNNKLWNALKLVKMWSVGAGLVPAQNNGQQSTVSSQQQNTRVSDTHHSGELNDNNTFENFAVDWFAERLNQVKAEVVQLIEQFRLSESLKVIYSLIWDDFCSWYLEWVKPAFGQKIGSHIYSATVSYFTELMALLHPYMPFITEEIYHLLADRKEGDDLCIYQIEKSVIGNETILKDGGKTKESNYGFAGSKSKNNLKQKDAIALFIQTNEKQQYNNYENILSRQLNTSAITITQNPPPNTINIVIDQERFFIQSSQPVDTSAQKTALEADLEYQQKFLESVNRKLSNEKFVQNAKPDVVALEQKKAADAQARIKVIQESLEGL